MTNFLPSIQIDILAETPEEMGSIVLDRDIDIFIPPDMDDLLAESQLSFERITKYI